MSWLPKWLGERYSKLYAEFKEEPFEFRTAGDVLEVADEVLLNVLSQLRKHGYLCVFRREGRRKFYRLFPPDLVILASQLGVKNFNTLKQGTYSHLLLKLTLELCRKYSGRLKSLVVFGSVARGTASAQSDVDVLTVIDGLKGSMASRVAELLEIEYGPRVGDELSWLSERGILTHVSFHPRMPEEMKQFQMLFLDVVADGIPLFDRDNFFESLRARFRMMLERMGAERRFADKDEWYWVMDPEAELGAVEI
jgi:predicted nucleotidyltransferase